MQEKLTELNICELSNGDYYKYRITCYEDITEIEYKEKDSKTKEWITTNKLELCSLNDIQICEKIIELRSKFEEGECDN